MPKKKVVVEVPPLCMCLQCGRSSNAKNQCAFEEKVNMSYCPTFFHMKKLNRKPVQK